MKVFCLNAILLTACTVALACPCGATHQPDTVAQDFDAADKVFRAKILDVELISSRTNIKGHGWVGRTLLRAEVEVTRSYKGETNNLIYVVTNPDSSGCGIPIGVGDDYIFFVDEVDHAQACSSSRSAQSAKQFGWDWETFIAQVEAAHSAS